MGAAPSFFFFPLNCMLEIFPCQSGCSILIVSCCMACYDLFCQFHCDGHLDFSQSFLITSGSIVNHVICTGIKDYPQKWDCRIQ